MVIYGGGSDSEENQAKAQVPVNHKVQGREHLAMVLQKFDWTKCSAMAILKKMNGGLVVAIVNTGSTGVIISESC